MQIFLFQSESDGNITGFTKARDGGNLPWDYAPWRAVGGRVIPTGTVLGEQDAVLTAIRRDGFFLARSKVGVAYSGLNLAD